MVTQPNRIPGNYFLGPKSQLYEGFEIKISIRSFLVEAFNQ